METQRESTRRTWEDISAKHDLPNEAMLDLQFVPSDPNADWNEFESSLQAAGFRSSRYEDGSTLEVSVGPIELKLDSIWQHELETTKIALSCEFRPDGWGFWSD